MNDDAKLALSLLEMHGARLHALMYRITLRADTCDDIMQELFLRLARPHAISSAGDPVAYAVTTAMRLAFDWRRAQRRRRESAPLALDPAGQSPSPAERLDQREDLQRVLDAIERLPVASRAIIVMRYLECRPYDEIARAMNRSVHQTRALCHKAVIRLRAALASPRAVISGGVTRDQ